MTITAKVKFNALQNAQHIFALKEEGTLFRLVELVESEENTKAIITREDGTVDALFTDSKSARDALREVLAVFGDEQPLVKIGMRQTPKGASVYFVEVQ